MLSLIVSKYNQIIYYLTSLSRITLQIFNQFSLTLPLYYHLTNLLWQDGLLIDFLQKKFLDKWIRQFVVNSANIFNERVVFSFIVKFYIDFILIPQNLYSYFELKNVASILTFVWLTLSVVIVLVNLNCLFLVFIPF